MHTEEKPSKTRRKRDSESLQKLGEQLITLKTDELNSLDLPVLLLDAIVDAKKISTFGAHKRQRQYIGKIMRDIDSETIESGLNIILARRKSNTAEFHRIEKWRDLLIDGNTGILTEIINRHPQVDRQYIHQLVRNANKELDLDKPPAAARKLFVYLREIVENKERST